MVKTATRDQLNRRARTLNAIVRVHRDREEINHEVCVEAPAGHVWSGLGVHEIVASGDGRDHTLGVLYFAVLDDMVSGVSVCDDATCEWCGRG